MNRLTLLTFCGAASLVKLPKAIVDMPDIKELLREKRGPLSRNSTRKNGCIEVASNGNHLLLTFSSGPKDREKSIAKHSLSEIPTIHTESINSNLLCLKVNTHHIGKQLEGKQVTWQYKGTC